MGARRWSSRPMTEMLSAPDKKNRGNLTRALLITSPVEHSIRELYRCFVPRRPAIGPQS